jgi:hypothetical protein
LDTLMLIKRREGGESLLHDPSSQSKTRAATLASVCADGRTGGREVELNHRLSPEAVEFPSTKAPSSLRPIGNRKKYASRVRKCKSQDLNRKSVAIAD